MSENPGVRRSRGGRGMEGDPMTVVPQFAPPGQGFWERDAVHFPRPLTRYWTDTHPEPFARGVHEFASSYGMLLDGLVMRYVNGVGYKQVVPVADDEVPVRFGRAEATFAEKLWRKQLGDWDGTVKPASIQAHLELQSVEADLLSDDRARGVPGPLPRPPRADDLPAHAVHGCGAGADRRLPRARRRLDRHRAGRAARADARQRAGIRRRVGSARVR